MSLFSAAGPSPGPRRAAETNYAFLCRAEGAYWGRVRALLEQWFATLAPEAQVELKRAPSASSAHPSPSTAKSQGKE